MKFYLQKYPIVFEIFINFFIQKSIRINTMVRYSPVYRPPFCVCMYVCIAECMTVQFYIFYITYMSCIAGAKPTE